MCGPGLDSEVENDNAVTAPRDKGIPIYTCSGVGVCADDDRLSEADGLGYRVGLGAFYGQGQLSDRVAGNLRYGIIIDPRYRSAYTTEYHTGTGTYTIRYLSDGVAAENVGSLESISASIYTHYLTDVISAIVRCKYGIDDKGISGIGRTSWQLPHIGGIRGIWAG